MTKKQQRFCEEYLVDCNATQAAIRAGYSKQTANEQASRLLANVNIKAYIDQKMQEMQKSTVASADEVIQYLTSVMRGQSSASVLSLCGDGCQEIIEKAPDEKERLKAAELLGKRYSLFSDKVNLEGAVPVILSGEEQLED